MSIVTPQNKTIEEKNSTKEHDFTAKTILIAEDDKIIQLYLTQIFKQTNATILIAENGQIAVDLFAKNAAIDLVLMDIRMPIMNGFEAIEKILQINPQAKIIAHSAFAMADEKEKCFKLGCKDYVTKPANKKTLFEVVEKWLN